MNRVVRWLSKLFGRGKAELKARWLKPDENPFGVEILDCRQIALGMMAFTASEDIAKRFVELRYSSGDEVFGRAPKDARQIRCNLRYPCKNKPAKGSVFKAQAMEDKWDIYFDGEYLYFSRSWTGELRFRAQVDFTGGEMLVGTIDAGKEYEESLAIREVDFLIKSHLIGLQVPHPLVSNLGTDPQKLAAYSFSEFGRRGLYGTFSDTVGLPSGEIGAPLSKSD